MEKLSSPLVSVIMPVYNEETFLRDAIESILSQTYTHWELIIVDDGSTDGTKQIITSYATRFSPFITALYLPHLGESAAANAAVAKSKGQLLARMDADDIAHPQRLEKQVAFLLSHPNTILVGSQATSIDSNNAVIGTKHFPLTHEKISEQFGLFHPLVHSSCMINRHLLPNPTVLYENAFEPNDEYFTFFKLLQYGDFANLPDYLLAYRIHANNKSLQHPKEKFFNSVKIRRYAVAHFSYRFSTKTYLLFLLQILVVSILPGWSIVPLYLLFRGVYHPRHLLKQFFHPYTTFPMSLPFLSEK